MRQHIALLALCASLAFALPARAEPPAPEEGQSLIEKGFDYLFRGLLAEVEPQLKDIARDFKDLQPQLQQLLSMVDDLRHYEAPRRLENGDILIPRRKDAPPPPALPSPTLPSKEGPAPQGETEL